MNVSEEDVFGFAYKIVEIEYVHVCKGKFLILPMCEKAGIIEIYDNSTTLHMPVCKSVDNIWIDDDAFVMLPECMKIKSWASHVHQFSEDVLHVPLMRK